MDNWKVINFMWADTMSDGSVLMGIYGLSKVSVEKIFSESGELTPGEHYDVIDGKELIDNAKISFHSSGRYKLTSKIKKGTIDRVTLQGLPLDQISQSTRMLEVLIPAKLQKTTASPRQDKDKIVDVTNFPIGIVNLLRFSRLYLENVFRIS